MRTSDRPVNVSVLLTNPPYGRMIDGVGVSTMTYDVLDFVIDGPEQNRRIVALRLMDGSEMTADFAISLIKSGAAKFRRWTGNCWKDVRIMHRKMWVSELDG